MLKKQGGSRTKLVVHGNSVYEIDLDCYYELTPEERGKYFPELQEEQDEKKQYNK